MLIQSFSKKCVSNVTLSRKITKNEVITNAHTEISEKCISNVTLSRKQALCDVFTNAHTEIWPAIKIPTPEKSAEKRAKSIKVISNVTLSRKTSLFENEVHRELAKSACFCESVTLEMHFSDLLG